MESGSFERKGSVFFPVSGGLLDVVDHSAFGRSPSPIPPSIEIKNETPTTESPNAGKPPTGRPKESPLSGRHRTTTETQYADTEVGEILYLFKAKIFKEIFIVG